jgi:hypothetical protein
LKIALAAILDLRSSILNLQSSTLDSPLAQSPQLAPIGVAAPQQNEFQHRRPPGVIFVTAN